MKVVKSLFNTLCCLGLLGGWLIPCTALGASSISGTVYKAQDDSPLIGTTVQIVAYVGDPCGSYQWYATANVDQSNGTYTIDGLADGEYYLYTSSIDDNYVEEWWSSNGSSQDCSQAEAVSVQANDQLQGRDFHLDQGGRISGTLYESDGVTAITGINANISVYTGDPCGDHQWVDTASFDNSNGTYTVDGLASGSYCLYVQWTDGNHLSEWWAAGGSVPDCAQAQTISITAGDELSARNFQLDPAASISGTIYESDGTTPINTDWVSICACVTDDPCTSRSCSWFSGFDPSTGNYIIMGLPPGDYYLYTCDFDGNYIQAWWSSGGSTADCSQAEVLSVQAGDELNGRDFQVGPGGCIAGTVYESDGTTPLTNTHVSIDVYTGDPCGSTQWIQQADIDQSDGTFEFVGLPQGTYYLYTSWVDGNYLQAWWASAGSTTDCSQAEGIAAAPGDQLTGRDFQLIPGATLSGHVVSDVDGQPVAGIEVVARNLSVSYWGHRHSPRTGTDGAYTISGLPPGDYILEARPGDSGYAYELYNDVLDSDQATVFSLQAGAQETDLDFSLALGGSISGQVTRADNGEAIQDLDLNAYRYVEGTYIWGARTESDGTYRIHGLPEGSYRIEAIGNGTPYRNEFYEDRIDWNEATPVSVLAGNDTDRIDFTLLMDTDDDGLDDDWEQNYFGGLSQGRYGDWDGDGLNELQEYETGTDPTKKDTDGDFISDSYEIWRGGTDPTDPQSVPSLPFEGSVMKVHEDDGEVKTYVEVWFSSDFLGDPETDIETITVTGPDGNVLYQKGDFEYLPNFRDYFVRELGLPALGLYRFYVKVKDRALEGTQTDHQAENRDLPVPRIDDAFWGANPVISTKTPMFEWEPTRRFDETLYYRLEIYDEGFNNRVYATGRNAWMGSYTLPEGVLTPGATYQWRVRVTDDCDWIGTQNRRNTPWYAFTMAPTLHHDAVPAVYMNNSWGALTWSTKNYGTDLLCSVRVVDQDGVSSDWNRGSHNVTVTYPDGSTRSLQYDGADGPNAASYYVYDNEAPQAGDYTFTVTDPDGNTGTATDTLVMNPLNAPDETTITPSLVNPSQEGIEATFDNVYVNGALYDDFDGYAGVGELDSSKWEPVGSGDTTLKDGAIHIQSSPSVGRYSNILHFRNPDSVSSLQADVTVLRASSAQAPKARLGGYFYSDGLQNVMASIRVYRDKVTYSVGGDRTVCGQVSWDDQPLAAGQLLPVTPGQTVTASISWDGTTFTFKADDQTATYTPEGEILPPTDSMKRIGVRVDLSLDDASPTFAWSPVPGANRYRLRIYNTYNNGTVWRGYTGEPFYQVPPGVLEPNGMYRFRVEAVDAHDPGDVDNLSKSPSSTNDHYIFYVGQEPEAPYADILSTGAQTWNDAVYGERLDLWTRVYDAQGVPENIRSVSVQLPNGKVVPLHYDSESEYNTATCGAYLNTSFEPIDSGPYTFRVEDRDGNVYTTIDEVTANPIGYPDEASLQATVNGTAVAFDWEDVPGVAFYRVEIYDEDYRRIHKLNTRESEYALAPGVLKEGTLYRYRITTRREFWDQNVDNGSSTSGDHFDMPTFVTGRTAGGANAPVIETRNLGAYAIHTVQPGTGEDAYMLFLECHVEDQDGVPENIDAVVVEGPNGVERPMFFSERTSRSGATYYGVARVPEPSSIPQGTYTFTVTDMDGNQAQATDELLVSPVPVPVVVSPEDGDLVSGTRPMLDWEDVPDAAVYRVRIYDGTYNAVHASGYLPESRYAVPEGVLEPNRTYSYRVSATREAYPAQDMDNYAFISMLRLALPHFTTTDPGTELPPEKGDLNGNGRLDLEDAIVALKAISRVPVSSIVMEQDADADAKIGLVEALYVLQHLAELR